MGNNSLCGGLTLQKGTQLVMCDNTAVGTLIYRELFALGRKIVMIKLIYRYLLAFGR
jgi:hypothetical protein